jgi:hypothetical protein
VPCAFSKALWDDIVQANLITPQPREPHNRILAFGHNRVIGGILNPGSGVAGSFVGQPLTEDLGVVAVVWAADLRYGAPEDGQASAAWVESASQIAIWLTSKTCTQ